MLKEWKNTELKSLDNYLSVDQAVYVNGDGGS